MVIYVHEENFRGEIETKKREAKEYEDLYILETCKRVSKEDIGKLLKRAYKRMYTLTPDNTPFIIALIKEKQRDIKLYKRALENSVARKTALLKLLDENLTNKNKESIFVKDVEIIDTEGEAEAANKCNECAIKYDCPLSAYNKKIKEMRA